MSDIKWWGYVHTNGSLQLKRYFSKKDLEEVDESAFVQVRSEPFEAINRDDAMIKFQEWLKSKGG